MRTFDEVAEEYGLETLDKPTLKAVEGMVHSFMAHAHALATDGRYLLVGRGNLDYYAGLDYCDPLETGQGWKLYMASEDDQVQTVIDHIHEAQSESKAAA